MVFGSNNMNWIFVEGGWMKGILSVLEMLKDSDGKFY